MPLTLGSVQRKLARVLLAAVVLLMAAVAGSFYLGRVAEATDDLRDAAAGRLAALDTMLTSVLDAETGQRGFVITGLEKYLDPYLGARERVVAATARARELYRGDALALQRLAALSALQDAKLAELQRVVEVRRSQGEAAARQLVLQDVGREYMQQIRQGVHELQEREQVGYQSLVALAESRRRAVLYAEGCAGLLMLAVAFAAYRSLMSQAERQEQRSRQLEIEALSEKRLRAITDNLPALIAHFDTAQRYLFANAHFRHALSVDPRALIGKALADGLDPAEHERLQPFIRAVLAGQSVSFESRLGSGRQTFQQHLVPDRAPDGSVCGFYSISFDITGLKAAEAQRQDSEARIRHILTHAPDAYIGMDRQGRITEWNRQAELTFGWTRNEVMGQDLAPLLIPEAARAAHVAGQRAFSVSGRGPLLNKRIEVTALHRDGREIPVEISITGVRAEDGFGASAFLRDITDRKAAQAKLEAGRKRLRDVTDNVPALIGYFDAEERCHFVNGPAQRLLKLPDDYEGLSLRSAIGETLYAVYAPHVAAAKQGQRAAFDAVSRGNTRSREHQTHLIPDWNTEGNVQGFYVLVFDVTALKEAEQARAEGERRLRAITDNLPALITYIDAGQRIVFANATFKDWLGVPPSQMLGRPLGEVIGPVLLDQRREHLDAALRGEKVSFEMRSQAMGVERHLKTVYIPDRRPNGEVAGLFALSTDVTAMKEVEQQLQQLARVDTLTGLANRRQFDEKLAEALRRRRRYERELAVLFLDVDRFKAINDTHGHAAGDLVLAEFARRLQSCVRSTDTVARLAGDEFVILLEGLGQASEASAVAEKIRAALRLPFNLPTERLTVTSSIGIAIVDEETDSPAALLARADEALYSAKRAGRNSFSVMHH
ncbi:PAS domain-containing protein [Eleftheria terrae]|uniref:PAS domain-containing protein n=1 Tax=Eleftheria terrae TaxID=1597781 RepID=UPI00263BD21E|nr:PAS domain-containing protein [Eleftheria terrae]WKB55480.1 PAS domain-containing protein [Eleftheria terrae]